MATVVERIIDTGGTGDYTSLSAWEAARQGDIVVRDTIELAKCKATTGATDNLQCVISGWTTDPEHYIWIQGDNSTQPTLLSAAPNYIIQAALATTTGTIRYPLGGGAGHSIIDRLQIKTRNVSGFGVSMSDTLASGWIRLSRLWVETIRLGSCEGSYGIYIRGSNVRPVVWNSCVWGFSKSAPPVNVNKGINIEASGAQAYIYNCTVSAPFGSFGAHGVSGESGVRVKNVLTRDCSTGFFTVNGFHEKSNFNASNIPNDAPGPDSRTGYATFLGDSLGTQDFHLVIEDTVARRQGLDLSNDPFLPFYDDMEGTPRLMVWDIGADQITQEDHLWPDRVRMLDNGHWYNWVGSGTAPGSAGGSSEGSGGSGGESGGEFPGGGH